MTGRNVARRRASLDSRCHLLRTHGALSRKTRRRRRRNACYYMEIGPQAPKSSTQAEEKDAHFKGGMAAVLSSVLLLQPKRGIRKL